MMGLGDRVCGSCFSKRSSTNCPITLDGALMIVSLAISSVLTSRTAVRWLCLTCERISRLAFTLRVRQGGAEPAAAAAALALHAGTRPASNGTVRHTGGGLKAWTVPTTSRVSPPGPLSVSYGHVGCLKARAFPPPG
jgi:hypothetical protein